MRALLSVMREESGKLKQEALLLDHILLELDHIIRNLDGETELDAVKMRLRDEKAGMAEQSGVLKRLGTVLDLATERYVRTEEDIIEYCDEADMRLFLVGYKEYSVPDIYMQVLEGF